MTGALLAMVAAATLGQAPEASPTPAQRLVRARVCYAALDFTCTETELASARAEAETLSPPERLELWRLSAETALATDQPAEAYLKELLREDPDFAPPEGAWGPAWREALEAARAALPDTAAPELTVEVPLPLAPNVAVEIVVQATDPSGVGRVSLVLPDAGPEPLRVALVTADGKAWRGTVPAEAVTLPALTLWVEAWDLRGNGPGRWGSPEAPRSVPVMAPVEEDEGFDAASAWWLWTSIGAVVAAGVGVSLYFALSEGGGGPSTGVEPAETLELGRVGASFLWPHPPD